MRRAACLLLALALLAGCSRPAPPPPASEEPAPAPPPPAVEKGQTKVDPPAPPTAPAGTSGATLLPRAKTGLSYALSDGTKASEFYVEDGERLIGAYNGKTYVTWFITPEGVFRQDPKGPALLRYLPPTLEGDQAWKQQSGDAEVWFRAVSRTRCQEIDPLRDCWELTVLNRQEQTRFQLIPGWGIGWVESLHLSRPGESYTKRHAYNPEPVPAPDQEAMIREGGRRPEGPLPTVTPVTLAEFEQTRLAMLREAGALVEADLDNDGKLERLEGMLGLWHPGTYALFEDDGQEVLNAFYTFAQNRLDLITLPGLDRPTLLHAVGSPGRWHSITPRWLRDGMLHVAWGWHPKTTAVWGGTVRAGADGHLVATGVPAELAGYDWTRWYRVDVIEEQHAPYRAHLVREEWKAGPHPTEPADLLTAAFIARWWELTDDLARYLPDQAVRDAFLAAEVKRPPYRPSRAELGKLTLTKRDSWPEPVPVLSPEPPAADGSTEFLVKIGLYEGYHYYAGRVTFAKGADGRLVISHLEITATGFVY